MRCAVALSTAVFVLLQASMAPRGLAGAGPDSGFKATAVPAYLIGLWAKGGKCGLRSVRLRVTAHTLKFANKPPVKFQFVPHISFAHPDNDGLVPYPKDDSKSEYDPMTYNENVRLIFYYGDDSDPNHIYFPCFGKPVTWPP